MTLPANFPAGFTVYQTENEGDTITRRYANSVAWHAAKARQPLPSGSIILQVTYKGSAIQSYSAMESRVGWGNTIPMLLRNGDWDYALFSADGDAPRPVEPGTLSGLSQAAGSQQLCFHTGRAAQGSRLARSTATPG